MSLSIKYSPSDAISTHFTYQEALWLPKWQRLGNEAQDGLTDTILANLHDLFALMDKVRDFFGAAIHVHVAWRPPLYNELVGGAIHSAHLDGMAVDFDVDQIGCFAARQKILDKGKLDEWGMRMEQLPLGSQWLHLDTRPPLAGHPRYFKP